MFDLIAAAIDLVSELLDSDVADHADLPPVHDAVSHGSQVHFGGSPEGVSDDSYQEPVSWSPSENGYFGDKTWRPMQPES